MLEKEINITTTPGFDNAKITDYIEPISAHVVIGMNVFKDFFSGITDIFGGNSGTYEITLATIHEKVLNKLKKKAYSIGANSIVGLKIDNDEIAAQGKSMIMVTATGTAVKANFPEKKSEILDRKLERIDFNYLDILIIKKRYLERAKENKLNINDAFWGFVKQNEIPELSEYILNRLGRLVIDSKDYVDVINKYKSNSIEYFTSIDAEIAVQQLYGKLKEDINEDFRMAIIEIIKEGKLIDYGRIIELIKHNDFTVKKSGVSICSSHKTNYDSSDIMLIKEIIATIPLVLTQRGSKSTKKKMLSSKEIDVWICECNKENEINDVFCVRCGNDIFGFKKDTFNPTKLTDLLGNKLDVLTQILK